MSASQWRIDLAREISSLYAADVIVLVGSPAFDLADAYSDIDIVMFWQDVPSDDARIQIGERYGLMRYVESFNHQAEFSLQNASEVIYVGENNLKVDITHRTIASQTQMIEDLVQHLDISIVKLGHIRSIDSGIVFKGEIQIETWRERYQPMPRDLAEKLLADYLYFWAYQPLQKLVIERNDPLFARQLMCETCEKIVRAICVINGQYPSNKTKHLRHLLQGLKQPDQTFDRVQEVCNSSIIEANHILKALIEDLFDLAEQSGYETGRERKHYAMLRLANEEEIKLSEEA